MLSVLLDDRAEKGSRRCDFVRGLNCRLRQMSAEGDGEAVVGVPPAEGDARVPVVMIDRGASMERKASSPWSNTTLPRLVAPVLFNKICPEAVVTRQFNPRGV